MSDEYVFVTYLFIEKFKQGFVLDLINHCLNIGCTTNKEGNMILCNYSSKETDGDIKLNSDITEAIDSISKNNEGSIQLWYKKIDFILQINLRDNIKQNMQHITMSFDPVFFREYNESSQLSSEFNVRNLIELFKEVYRFTKATYVYGDEENSVLKYNIRLTMDEIIDGVIRNIFWINILSQSFVKKIGKQKLLSTPTWKVEELSDGGILLVLTPNPLNINETEKKKEEVKKYLGLK